MKNINKSWKELQPINQQVLIDITEDVKEAKTASGIILPDNAKEKQKIGKVTAINNIEKSRNSSRR